jgi:4a-hydroxytetrahydrobiopterin dehydratase
MGNDPQGAKSGVPPLEHRPDLDIRWDTLLVTMTTHTAGNVVTDLDFKLARRIDEIAQAHGAAAGI